MKNLILGNCNHLIKFILFGDEENDDSDKFKNKGKENEKEEFKIKHIPRNNLWQKRRKRHKYIKINDLIFSNKNKHEIPVNEIPGNDMALAIYHYKGKF